MILVFDLDDTLYDERQYVESGLRSVAEFGHESFGWDTEKSLEFMNGHLESQGRGAIFDAWLASHGKGQKHLIRQCVRAYRHHQPNIQLYPSAKELLKQRRSQPLYVVTDGHKIVQCNRLWPGSNSQQYARVPSLELSSHSSPEFKDQLNEMLQTGARDMIAAAVAGELAEFLAQQAAHQDEKGRRAVMRNGYQPERSVLTGVGEVAVKIPKTRDRSGRGIHFRSALVPPYLKKTRRVEEVIPCL